MLLGLFNKRGVLRRNKRDRDGTVTPIAGEISRKLGATRMGFSSSVDYHRFSPEKFLGDEDALMR